MTPWSRLGWLGVFLLLAVAAVWVNASSRRIFILHEGRAEQPSSRAFFAGAERVLGRLSHLKARHQYLGADADACRQAWAQLQAFQPDAVIAEGAQAQACLSERWRGAAHAQVRLVQASATGAAAHGRAAFIASWATLLGELSSGQGPVMLLHGGDPAGLAERDLLTQAAAQAGLAVQWVDVSTPASAGQPLAWPEALRGPISNVVVLGHSVGWGAARGTEQALRGLVGGLRQASPQPILATRLDRVFWGVDMALDESPEQRGEQMALTAWRGDRTDPLPPLEMAVALRAEFAERRASSLPSIYRASARLAGFWAPP